MPTDLSRIEPHLLKNNYLLMLGFPKGYVPLRVVQRSMFFYMYDPIVEGQLSGPLNAGAGVNGISDLYFVEPARLPSNYATGKPFNVFANTKDNMLYQLFYGISPSAVRVFLNQPATIGQNNLIEFNWSNSDLAFGYIDGFESPLDSPSPLSEIFVPPGLDFALGYANPLPYPVRPMLKFVVNVLNVEVIKDVELIDGMLRGKVPATIKTVGGLSEYNYDTHTHYGVYPLPLGTPKAKILAVMEGGQ